MREEWGDETDVLQHTAAVAFLNTWYLKPTAFSQQPAKETKTVGMWKGVQ